MSQPALSHQISALEKELGVPVAERLWRGVRLTVVGRAAAEEARIALRAAENAVQIGKRVGDGRDGGAGRLRISCVETMTTWLLVPVLRRWRTRRPGVALDLTEFTSADAMAEVLVAGGTDIAVGPRPTRTEAHIDVIGQQEMVVVAAAGHRFAAMSDVPMEALADEMFVHYDPANAMAIWLDQYCAQHQVVLKPVLRTRSPRTAAQLAAADMGVTIVPVSALPSRPPEWSVHCAQQSWAMSLRWWPPPPTLWCGPFLPICTACGAGTMPDLHRAMWNRPWTCYAMRH